MSSFKRGAVIGFAAGYVQGSKAGRDRYEQINAIWKKFKTTPTYDRLSAQVGNLVGFGLQRGRLVALDTVTKATQKFRTNISGKAGHNAENN